MGAVYEGVRVQLGRTVAVKFLHRACASNPDSQLRFEREAVAMSKLSHPNCVGVIDFGVDDGPYIVMDFVSGKTLRELIDEDSLTPDRSIALMMQMLAGLQHAHEKQLVHRDVKPANVKVSVDDSNNDYVRVLDFGLAKLTDPAAAQLTEEGIVAGTTTYMSPEHARGAGIDGRSDVYSAGLVLFEMLTGRPPYVSETAAGMLLMHRDQVAPRLSEVESPVRFSRALERIVEKALAKDKSDRFQTAAAFAAALRSVPEAQADYDPERSGTIRWRELPRELFGRAPHLGHRRKTPRRLGLITAATALFLVAAGTPLLNGSTGQPDAQRVDANQVSSQPAPHHPEAETAEEAKPLIDPSDNARAAELLMRGDHQGARAHIERLLDIDPDNPELNYMVGSIYFESRRWKDGIEAYARAIEKDPEYRSRPLISRNMIRGLRNQRIKEDARAMILEHLRDEALPHLEDALTRTRQEQEQQTLRELIALVQAEVSDEESAKTPVEATSETPREVDSSPAAEASSNPSGSAAPLR